MEKRLQSQIESLKQATRDAEAARSERDAASEAARRLAYSNSNPNAKSLHKGAAVPTTSSSSFRGDGEGGGGCVGGSDKATGAAVGGGSPLCVNSNDPAR